MKRVAGTFAVLVWTLFPTHEWLVPGARIVHLVQDRFGPEEHMRIKRLGA